MRKVSLIIFAAIYASIAVIGTSEAEDMLTLENKVLRIAIRKTPAPYICQLAHKATQISVISEPDMADLFAIALLRENGDTLYLGSSRAKNTRAEVQKIDGGSKAVMTYSNFDGLDLWARVTGVCEMADPLTRWSIELRNRTGRQIRYVRFPLVKAVSGIGSPDDDVIILPYLPGSLIENPWRNWPVGQGAWLRYPGDLSAQFIAYQDRKAGIYLSSMDIEGYPLLIAIWKGKDGFCLCHDFQFSADVTEEWKSPYPVAIGVTQGTWCDSADIYKTWALRQPWCAKTLAQREEIPQWWKDGPLVHVCEVRTYDNKRACSGSYYPKLLDHLRYLQKQVDGRIVVMLAGWENHRRWTGGDYFPVFDQQNAKNVIAHIKKEGFRPFFYLSGLYYTFENEGVDGEKIPAAAEYLPYFVVDQETGKPEVFTLNESSPNTGWKRHSYAICVGTHFAKKFFRSVIDHTHELGVNILQMDQTVSGAGLPCYSTKHGHVPGIGLYQAQAFYDLLRNMREYGKSKSKDFVLFHEEPHEQLIPYLDGFHVREYKEKWWYRALPGAVGIPLFSYLYHEYAIGYGGDSARLSKSDDRWSVRMHAVNLVTGRTPGVAVWSYPQQLFEAHPDQLKMIRNHCRLLKTGAKKYLMLGRMLHPYELNVPSVTYQFWAGKREKRRQYELAEPSVLTSSWQSPDGNVGHLFVNASKSMQELRVKLDTRNAPPFPSCDVDIYSSEGDAQFTSLWTSVSLPKDLARELAPLEVVFVDIRKVK